MHTILIEGYTPEEILALSNRDIDQFVFTGETLIFRAGSATILGKFRLTPDCLIVELAHIEGGGEGVLPTLWMLVTRYARQRGIFTVEWIVHAVACAAPNAKLQRVLQRRGFVIRDLSGYGTVYHYQHQIDEPRRET
jgi:hypothetical protein